MSTLSLPAALKDFLTAYVLGVIALIIASYALSVFAGIELPSSIGIVPFIIGVQIAAQRHVKRGGGRISGGAAWKGAVAMTFAAIVVSLLLVAFIAAVLGFGEIMDPELLGSFSTTVWLSVLAFVFILYTAIARICLGWMIRLAVRNAELEQ